MRIPKGFLKVIYKIFVESPLSIVGKPVYRTMTAIELAIHRYLVSGQSDGDPTRQELVNTHLTAIIKTFERPEAVRRLVASIKVKYPDLHIIVADDSQYAQEIDGVETILLPYNQGATVGRNAALSRVKTKYFLLLDDDFVFYRLTDLENPLSILDANQQIDIIGGEVVDLPFFTVSDYSQAALFPTDKKATLPKGSSIAGLPVFDMVANFFLARTDRVKVVGWDPNLKNLAHADFFTRAKGVLTTVFDHELKVLHAKTPFDTVYMKDRNDVTFDRAVLLYRYDHKKTPPENDQKDAGLKT